MGDKSPKSAAKNNKQKASQKAAKQAGRSAPVSNAPTPAKRK